VPREILEYAGDLFFETLNKLGFGQREGNVMTSCVFAWEERAEESSRFMRETIDSYVSTWSP
jgi:myo-inositol catabolism protein IolH